jgi:CheY-like chemotaxis protein
MPKTIAWIEDDTDIIEPVVEPLLDAKYRIRRFNTAREALEGKKEIREADLILLDMLLRPGIGDRDWGTFPGLTLLRELRDEKIDIPVVVLSVVDRDEVKKQLDKLGVIEILRKPVRPSYLKEVVERILAKKKSK